jgi:hypothetical protein
MAVWSRATVAGAAGSRAPSCSPESLRARLIAVVPSGPPSARRTRSDPRALLSV